MTKKKGRWVREGEGEILVEGAVKDDWQKIRKRPENQELQPQQKKVIQAGKETAKRCKGLKGDNWKTCQSKVLDEFYPQRRKSSV
jgi:hypothetical protein|tara:strand:+ start:12313 stop:12567 length:255 start_codon:yes stop_codon:yes gene_type:complete